MSYLAQDKIRVFPFGGTRSVDPYSRMLNEQNITDLLKHVTDYPSYVLAWDNTKNKIQFVLGGYYFDADISAIISKPLYAHIAISTISNYGYLDGGDVVSSASGSGTAADRYIVPEGCSRYTYSESSTYCFSYTNTTNNEVTIHFIDSNDSCEIRNIANGDVNNTGDRVSILSGQTCTFDVHSTMTATLYIHAGTTGEFTGITFDTEGSVGDATYSLQLLDETGNVPAKSFYKHQPRSLNIRRICCGTSMSIMD